MFYISENGKYLQPNVAFEHRGIQFPANWLNLSTLEDKEAYGISEVTTQGEYKDSKYYWNSESFESGVRIVTNIQRPIEQLREQKVSEIKNDYESILTTLEVSGGSNVFEIEISEKARSDWKDVYIGSMSAGKVPVSIRDANNNNVNLTFEEFEFVIAQISFYIQTQWNKRCQLIDLVRSESITTLEQILEISFKE